MYEEEGMYLLTYSNQKDGKNMNVKKIDITILFS